MWLSCIISLRNRSASSIFLVDLSTFSLSPHWERQRRVLKVFSLKRERAQSIRKRKNEREWKTLRDRERESHLILFILCVVSRRWVNSFNLSTHSLPLSHTHRHLTHRTHLYCLHVNVVALMTWSHTRVNCRGKVMHDRDVQSSALVSSSWNISPNFNSSFASLDSSFQRIPREKSVKKQWKYFFLSLHRTTSHQLTIIRCTASWSESRVNSETCCQFKVICGDWSEQHHFYSWKLHRKCLHVNR